MKDMKEMGKYGPNDIRRQLLYLERVSRMVCDSLRVLTVKQTNKHAKYEASNMAEFTRTLTEGLVSVQEMVKDCMAEEKDDE